jgi:threonine aldolase
LATHLDGARLFNAAVALKMDAKDLCAGFESVSVCLSKGLGAPAGTLLFGSSGFIARATRVRKILGGGMRQVGVLAAAGLYALDHNVDRLHVDHEHAARLAQGLARLGVSVEHYTNMVFVHVGSAAEALAEHLLRHQVLVLAEPRMRLVTHLDVDAVGIDRTIAAFAAFRFS